MSYIGEWLEKFTENADMEKVKKADATRFQSVFTNQNHTADRAKDVAMFASGVNKKRIARPRFTADGAENVNDVLKQQPEYIPYKLPTQIMTTTN